MNISDNKKSLDAAVKETLKDCATALATEDEYEEQLHVDSDGIEKLAECGSVLAGRPLTECEIRDILREVGLVSVKQAEFTAAMRAARGRFDGSCKGRLSTLTELLPESVVMGCVLIGESFLNERSKATYAQKMDANENLKNQLNDSEQRVLNLREENITLTSENEKLQGEVKKVTKKLNDLLDMYNTSESEKAKLEGKLEERETQINNLLAKLEAATEKKAKPRQKTPKAG